MLEKCTCTACQEERDRVAGSGRRDIVDELEWIGSHGGRYGPYSIDVMRRAAEEIKRLRAMVVSAK